MKYFKRVLAFVMTLVLLVTSLSFVVYAKTEEKEIVVRMYICDRTYDYGFHGHSWLYFENLTDQTLMVGIYPMPAGEGVTVGTYGHMPGGRGVYYNVEGYRYNRAKTTDMVYISKDLTQKQLDRVSKKIVNSNYWTYILNCAFFSISTWDVVSGKFLLYMLLPILVKLAIMIYPHQTGIKMYYPRLDQIYKQVGMGKNATMVPTSPDKE